MKRMISTITICIFSVLIISCNHTDKPLTKEENEDVKAVHHSEKAYVENVHEIIEPKDGNDQLIDFSKTVEPFIEKVLKENQRRHELEIQNNGIQHLDIFSKNGLQEIIAFSDKRYPRRTEPNYYEHFILFALRYEDVLKAEKSYDEIKNIFELKDEEYENLEEYEKQRIREIEISAKPGGMICQKGEYVFSLVETCRETPIGGKWEEYEDVFLSFITEPEEEIMILNADCGQMKYREEKRKPAHNKG